MSVIEVFEENIVRYEEWFDKHKYVFESEMIAIADMLPNEGRGIEVGIGTGRYALSLGIKEGVEPSSRLREMAIKRGLEVIDGVAEDLPYKDLHFDFVLMVFSISYFTDVNQALREAFRVLKRGGVLVIGFVDKNSTIGKEYRERRKNNEFYKNATFYSPEQLTEKLKIAGFKKLTFNQTLFEALDQVQTVEAFKEGYGEGSFVVVKAEKPA